MSTVQEILNKLHRLKDQASTAPDFLSLQKVSGKVDKIRAKLADYTNNKQFSTILDKIDLLIRQKNKYFRQKIIKTSNKLIGEDTVRNQDANRTLKYSKSAENLKIGNNKKNSNKLMINGNTVNKTISGQTGQFNDQNIDQQQYMNNKIHKDKTVYIKSNRQNLKSREQQVEPDDLLQTSSIKPPQTQVNMKKGSKKHISNGNSQKNFKRVTTDNNQSEQEIQKTTYNIKNKKTQYQQKQKLKGQVEFLEQKLTFSMKQIEDLTKKVSALQNYKQIPAGALREHKSPMQKNYIVKQQSVVDEYSQKIRQKSFIIQDLTGKVQYLSSMNQQLKSRIVNLQRRNEQQVDELRAQVKKWKKQAEQFKKKNDDIMADVGDLQQKNQALMNEIKKLVNKLEQQTKDKQKMKKIIATQAASKSQDLEKQIAHLSAQSSNLQKLQIKLQHEQQEKQQLLDYKQKLQLRIHEIQIQSKKYEQDRNRIELDLFKLEQENKLLRDELKVNISAKQILAQELLQIKQRYEEQLRATDLLAYQNDLKVKNKLSKLKQIKGLLTELR